MVHAGALPLEERVSLGGNPFQAFTTLVADFFLDTFSHQRHLFQEMQEYEQHGKFMEAANYACQLKHYDHAFTLYNQAVAEGNRSANIPAAELAECLGDYEKGLRYRVQGEDFGYAGIDAVRLGRHEEANKYWRRLRGE